MTKNNNFFLFCCIFLNSNYTYRMIFQIRNGSFTFYRVFFIGLFLFMGVLGLGSGLMESYTDTRIFSVGSEFDNHALQLTCTIMGILGFCTAFMMIFLLREKRGIKFERRKQFKPVNFTDRRTSRDRRAEA